MQPTNIKDNEISASRIKQNACYLSFFGTSLRKMLSTISEAWHGQLLILLTFQVKRLYLINGFNEKLNTVCSYNAISENNPSSVVKQQGFVYTTTSSRESHVARQHRFSLWFFSCLWYKFSTIACVIRFYRQNKIGLRGYVLFVIYFGFQHIGSLKIRKKRFILFSYQTYS